MATELTSSKDVVIASTYGRGHWLAAHLSEQGWSVVLLDYTSALGEWHPADYDGPLGLFESDALTVSQKSHWISEFGNESSEEVKSGFTLLLKDGPLDGHGPLATYLAQQHSLSLTVRNYLHMVNDLTDVRLKNERAQIAKMPYSATWLARLMHQIHSNVYVENTEAHTLAHAIPFFARYHIRSASTAAHNASLSYLRSLGVEVFERSQIANYEIVSDELVAITANDTIYNARSFVWTLSSRETFKVAPEIAQKIYPRGEIEPSWAWQRFDVSFKEAPKEVPSAFAILQDPFLAWTHSNLVSVQKQPHGWFAWMRLPVSQSKKSSYLAEQASEFEKIVNQRLPWVGARVMPTQSEQKWFLYSPEKIDHLKIRLSKNVFASGPEHWDGVDPLSQMLSHREVLLQLEAIRRVWDARQARRETKELQRQAKQKAKEKSKDERMQR